MINIVIPMAGLGSRFAKAGYEKPKPFIDVGGKPMIVRVLENLTYPDARYILIARKEHIEKEYEKTRQDIIDADERREWIDWIGKYGESLEIRTSSEKKKREFIEGLLRRIVVKGEHTKNRDGKLVQLGHSFDIQFKMNIVNDKLEYNNLQNKSEGYKIIDGKTAKKTPIIDVMSGRGQPKKKEGRYLKKQVKTVLTSSVTVE